MKRTDSTDEAVMKVLDEARYIFNALDQTTELEQAYYELRIGAGYWYEIYWAAEEGTTEAVQVLIGLLFWMKNSEIEVELFDRYDKNKEACDAYYKKLR